jgi:uncharacterized protein (DUF433 family)
VRGMRIRASDILEMLGLGVSQADILQDFPDLVEDDIKACLLLAAQPSEREAAVLAGCDC